MANRKQREQTDRLLKTAKLAARVRQRKYDGVVPLPMSRRDLLVRIGRSHGGGSPATIYDYPAVGDLFKKGLAAPHKNLPGYYICTAEGRQMYETLMKALEED